MDNRIFTRLVLVGFIKYLTLSVAGMIDCAVVGRSLGASGLSAMKLAMPVFSILSLFSTILGTGLSVTVSRDLTRGRKEDADRTVNSVITVTLVLAVLCMAAGLLFSDRLTAFFAGSAVDPDIFKGACDYLSVILYAALPILMYDVLGSLAILEGADRYIQCASVMILAADVAGDLIAVKLKAGMTGIAVASAGSYLMAFLVICHFFTAKRSMFRIKAVRPDTDRLKDVIIHGMPMVIKSLCGIVWPMSVNRIMLTYGSTAGLAALSVQDAVHYLPAALCSGVAGAVLIMTGIYEGEQDKEGLRKVNRHIIQWSLIGGLIIALPLAVAANPILRLFTDDPEVLSLSVTALRLFLVGVPFLSLNFSAASYLQGIGKNVGSGTVIFINHILVSIGTAFVLARLYGTSGVFASYGLCEIIMWLLILGVMILFLIRRQKSDVFRKVESPELRMSIRNVSEAVAASQRVNAYCLENEIDLKVAHHISLCTEELAVNSIEHGFNDGRKHHLEMRVFISKNRTLYLRLRDDCRRFDLTERYRIINPEDPSKNIGLRIVFASADEIQYSSALNLNNVCVRYVMPGAQVN